MKILSDREMLSLADVCRELSISKATAKNWIKLGKLTPANNKTTYFSIEYVKKLKSDISNGSNVSLKSRRNKKFVSGRGLHYSYVPGDSKNLPSVQELIRLVSLYDIKITIDILLSILTDCALKLILSRTGFLLNKPVLQAFLDGEYKPEPYTFLIDDLIDGNTDLNDVVYDYPELFTINYTYEEEVDVIGLLYISLKSTRERKCQGCYYTPSDIAKKLCRRLITANDLTDKKVLDPCCGTGNFILQLPGSFNCKNVYGNDIDLLSVKLARINYALKYRLSDKELIYSHITASDYLYFPKNQKFDYILGNPPWGYNYSPEEKIKIHDKFDCATTLAIESYDIFIEKALDNLALNGILSFVLPQALLTVKSHTPIRKIILEKCSFDYLEFLSKGFESVNCPSMILQMEYTGKPFSSVGMKVKEENREYTININRKPDAGCCSFNTTDDEYKVIKKIENGGERTTLAGRSTFALGVITGDNKKFLSDTKSDKNEQILSGGNIFKYRVKKSSKYIEFKPELYQQVAPAEIYRADEKLIYRFICNQLVMAYDNKNTLTLNSCNILIPHISGLNTKYILGILNSRTVQFYFRKMFNSVKILRSHIEKIPIPVVNRYKQEEIIQLTDKILRTEIKADSFGIVRIYNELDLNIAGLYGLGKKEYEIILKSMENENLFLP